MTHNDPFVIAGKKFDSRLLVGTGRYASPGIAREAIAASGAEIVTVAVRRAVIDGARGPVMQEVIDPEKYLYLPNTAGCYTAEEAVRTCRLARELGGWTLVKLEVIGDKKTLYPDTEQTIKATDFLVREGFQVMAYTTDDGIVARKLEDAGASAIMPLAAPIGSGLGILNPHNISLIVHQANVPVLVDAGIGTASEAAFAMELGCAGVLMNTAIAEAKDPIGMARAMKLAVEAGRLAFLAGRMPRRGEARASSPTGTVTPKIY